MKVTPFEVYQTYLSFKNHFTKEKYDYFKYSGKTNASITSFNKRRDRYFFEKMSRQKSDIEIKEYFLSNFITEDPSKIWIKEIIQNGENRYTDWKKKNQSLSYIFSEEVTSVFETKNFDAMFSTKKGHPVVFKKYLGGELSIETMVILDKILGFRNDFDSKLTDPVWISVSLILKKYEPFLNIDVFHFKKILKEIIKNGT
tara:strand:+ start:367 stop:966 length:600 start_codon:yes stop_codon:yes gene_type:complete